MPTTQDVLLSGPTLGLSLGPLSSKKRHTSITFNDPYTGIQHANTEAEKQAFLNMSKAKFERNQLKGRLSKYDAEQGKFFDQMRQGFRERSQSLASNQLSGGLGALNQSAARAGTSFSGVNEAAQSGLYGQIGAAQTQAQSEYDQKLSELSQTQRNAFIQGEFDFFNQLQGLAFKNNLDKDLLKFQADLADQYSSGWNDFFNVVGQGIGMAFGGPAGAAIGGQAGKLVGGAVSNAINPYTGRF